MDTLIQHIAENPVGYVAVLACAIPILFLLRKYVGPIIFHTCEIIVYAAVFHVVFGGIVRFLAWFRDASSFEHYDTSGVVTQLQFTTPMMRFWDQELYVPQSLYYVEVVAFFLIVFIVVWYRPIGTRNRYRGKAGEPGARSSARKGKMNAQFDRNRRRTAYEARYQPRHR